MQHDSGTRRVVPHVLFAVAAGQLLGCQPVLDLTLSQFIAPENQFGTDPGRPVYKPQEFVNWETPHVSPLAMTPGGGRLLAVNTPDNRLEVFDLTAGGPPVLRSSVPVGLEPVSVRARDDREVWVVNHVSDSVSVVDLELGSVVKTLTPGDEPTDVAFAGGLAFVVCSQINRVIVYDLANLDAAPRVLEIEGEDPRALAVSPDGAKVYVAIFESGNGTTLVPHALVSDPSGPYGGQNPPPNRGEQFSPPLRVDLPPSAALGLIVRKDVATGRWLDDNGADWSGLVTWDLHDHDVAVIDVATLSVEFISNVMNLNMHLVARGDGRLAIVGTEALNHVRYEPNATGRFVRSVIALVDPAAAVVVSDLNPHLADAYAAEKRTLPVEQRAASLADPRGVVFDAAGDVGYVSGLGSNNVARIDADGNRLGQLDVGQGPTGLVLDTNRGRLYVLNRFDATISTIDTTQFAETGRVAFFDPTPAEIKAGRPFLYDARRTSGLGITSCAACHVDARMDPIAWDLGDPAGAVKPFNQFCEDLIHGDMSGACADFHPLKGPMLTQTLQGIVGTEPLHWRGDRENLAAFSPAYVGLLGNDREPLADEMAAFEAFVATITYPPNPNRNLDNSLKTKVAGGDAVNGRELFVRGRIDTGSGADLTGQDPLAIVGFELVGGIFSCNACHVLPTGTNRRNNSARDLNKPQGMKIAQLRSAYEKTGFLPSSRTNSRGFGYMHDGAFGTVEEFLTQTNFHFGEEIGGDQGRRDVSAFVLSLGTDTHAGVGLQVTLDGSNNKAADTRATLDLMLRLADQQQVGLVVRGRRDGRSRGYAYVGNNEFQADNAAERVAAASLRSATGSHDAVTWTLVPLGSQTRIGIDRDLDGVFDADE
jgi:YVTN family beta-propeller protein